MWGKSYVALFVEGLWCDNGWMDASMGKEVIKYEDRFVDQSVTNACHQYIHTHIYI